MLKNSFNTHLVAKQWQLKCNYTIHHWLSCCPEHISCGPRSHHIPPALRGGPATHHTQTHRDTHTHTDTQRHTHTHTIRCSVTIPLTTNINTHTHRLTHTLTNSLTHTHTTH